MVELALLLGIFLTSFGVWLSSAVDDVRRDLADEVISRNAGPPDRNPDPFEVTFNAFWDEVDPGSSVTSRKIRIEGVEARVEVGIEGEGKPEISIDKAAFSSKPQMVGAGQDIRVRMNAPETLGESFQAKLTVGERSAFVFVRSRQEGAFAFDPPKGARIESVPATGEVMRIPLDLSTVETPELHIEKAPAAESGLDFALGEDGIVVNCRQAETCIGRHAVGFRVTAQEVSETDKGEIKRKDREVSASYILDIASDVPLGFITDADLGQAVARAGVVARIELVATGVQGVVVEMDAEDGRQSKLRLQKAGETEVVIICDDPRACVGQRSFTARAESWNPRRVAIRRFRIDLRRSKEEARLLTEYRN